MTVRKERSKETDKPFWKRHSLSLTAAGILALCFVLYLKSDPKSQAGSFFGNAIADWTGVVITILATKWFFEKGSRESRQPKVTHRNRFLELLHEHSLTIFLVITGICWLALFLKVDPDSSWGTVVSNMVSEWSQQIGLVLLTKKLIETGSKESSDTTDSPKK
jgi:uncharacterized membrane protein YidH (DUF202 family)